MEALQREVRGHPKGCTISTLICLIEVVGGEGAGGGAARPGMLNRANKYQGHLATLRREGKASLLFGDCPGLLGTSLVYRSQTSYPGAFKLVFNSSFTHPETYFSTLTLFYVWQCVRGCRETEDIILSPKALLLVIFKRKCQVSKFPANKKISSLQSWVYFQYLLPSTVGT